MPSSGDRGWNWDAAAAAAAAAVPDYSLDLLLLLLLMAQQWWSLLGRQEYKCGLGFCINLMVLRKRKLIITTIFPSGRTTNISIQWEYPMLDRRRDSCSLPGERIHVDRLLESPVGEIVHKTVICVYLECGKWSLPTQSFTYMNPCTRRPCIREPSTKFLKQNLFSEWLSFKTGYIWNIVTYKIVNCQPPARQRLTKPPREGPPKGHQLFFLIIFMFVHAFFWR